jgi:hypothetical protein
MRMAAWDVSSSKTPSFLVFVVGLRRFPKAKDCSDGVAAPFCANPPRAATGSRGGYIEAGDCPAVAPASGATCVLLPSTRLGTLGCGGFAPLGSAFGPCVLELSTLLFAAVARCGPGWPAAGLV